MTGSRTAIVILLAALASTAGCTNQATDWTPAQSNRTIEVNYTRLAYEIHFAPNEERPRPDEMERLAAFLEREAVGYGDRISFVAAARTPVEAALSGRRQAALRASLARRGLTAGGGIENAAESRAVPADTVLLSIGRYVVTPPPCPDWSRPPTGDYTNNVGGNFGCATAYNLGLMVADPGDLVHGRTPGPADGDRAAIAIERYKADKIKPLLDSDTRVQGSASQAGGAK